MTAPLQQVIESLRNELQQYGEMLALLEAQREVVSRREPASVLTSISLVESQSAAIEIARRERQTAQQQLAWSVGRPDDESFARLLPLLPDSYRPLVAALVEEINQLLERVRERATSNHAQLRRSLDLMERFIGSISAQAQSAALDREQEPPSAEPPLAASA